jgi:polyisoprenoid-binding protein YceI
VLIKGFKFENQLMEDHFNENYMESTQFPKADFKGYIKNIKDVDLSKDGKYPISIEGTLTIHGVAQKVSTAGTLEVGQGKPTIIGEFSIKIKDYGIKGLYIGDKIANEAKIKVNCKYQN